MNKQHVVVFPGSPRVKLFLRADWLPQSSWSSFHWLVRPKTDKLVGSTLNLSTRNRSCAFRREVLFLLVTTGDIKTQWWDSGGRGVVAGMGRNAPSRLIGSSADVITEQLQLIECNCRVEMQRPRQPLWGLLLTHSTPGCQAYGAGGS